MENRKQSQLLRHAKVDVCIVFAEGDEQPVISCSLEHIGNVPVSRAVGTEDQ